MHLPFLKGSFIGVLLAAATSVHAGTGIGRLADIEIYDRTSGNVLPMYWHGGHAYVAGQPGHEYELRLRNRSAGRVLAVASVDGVNVITGETASQQQSGYVLDRYGALTVSGWRKSLSRTAAFYFTALPDSYAARTGRPHDVGVIGVALFRETPRHRYDESEIARQAPARPAGDAARTEQRSAPAPSSGRDGGYASDPVPEAQEKLGTGHGRSERSSARYTQFERASSHPDEIVTIYYDSHANLIAQGVIPAPYWPPRTDRSRAFPAGFVPDP